MLHTYAGLIALFLAQSSGLEEYQCICFTKLHFNQCMAFPGSVSGPQSQSQARKDHDSKLVREAKSHFERALSLEQGNVVALGFIDKVRLP